MDMEEKKGLTFTEDQKEVVARRSKDIHFAINQLNEWVGSNSLTEEMKETLPRLAEQHLDDIKKTIGVSAGELDRLKEMTRSLNKAREERMKELEGMVENQNSILIVKQQLQSIGEKITKWWNKEGFGYVKEITFSPGGHIIVKFGFMLRNLSLRYSDTPNSDRKKMGDKIKNFIDEGYIFAKGEDTSEKDLIDCDANRLLLTRLVKSIFPSAEINSWENLRYMEKGPDSDKHFLRLFTVYINDYEDIEKM